MSFATNTLGGLVLSQRLLPALEAAGGGARVVFVSSGGMYKGGHMHECVCITNARVYAECVQV